MRTLDSGFRFKIKWLFKFIVWKNVVLFQITLESGALFSFWEIRNISQYLSVYLHKEKSHLISGNLLRAVLSDFTFLFIWTRNEYTDMASCKFWQYCPTLSCFWAITFSLSLPIFTDALTKSFTMLSRITFCGAVVGSGYRLIVYWTVIWVALQQVSIRVVCRLLCCVMGIL